MYSKIINQLQTVEDVHRLREEIAALQAALFATKKDAFDEELKNGTRAWVAQAFQEALTKESNKATYLEGLLAELDTLIVIELTIAIEPTLGLIDQMASFIRESAGTGTVLQIKVDPTIIAGVVITYKGEYRDFSLCKVAEEVLDHSWKTGKSQK